MDFLESAGDHFLQHVSEDRIAVFASKFEAAYSLMKGTFDLPQPDRTSLFKVYEQMTILNACARALVELKVRSDHIIKDVETRTKMVVLETCSSHPGTVHQAKGYQNDLVTTKSFRRWFLDNIAYPFPSADIKHKLVALINLEAESGLSRNDNNQSTSYDSCQLWFINSRRRSQWTRFYRKFADSQPGRMLTLCQALKKQDADTRESIEDRVGELLSIWRVSTATEVATVAKECINHFDQVVSWIQQKPPQAVGSWLDDAIEQGKQEFKEARRLAEVHRQRLRDVMQGEATQAVHNAEANNRFTSVKRKSSSHDEDDSRHSKIGKYAELSAGRGHRKDQVGQPSGTRSSRTFSGSSASSHGSMPSLIEAGSSSYDSCEGLADTRIESVQSTSYY